LIVMHWHIGRVIRPFSGGVQLLVMMLLLLLVMMVLMHHHRVGKDGRSRKRHGHHDLLRLHDL
jgi:hypothetical protein